MRNMPIGAPKSLTQCQQFFLEPGNPRQRQYEALRARYVDGRPSAEVAKTFGYSPGAFRVLCHSFRREREPEFFVSPRPGPRSQPKKSRARQLIIELRKKNYSVYDISETLKNRGQNLSPTAVGEILKEEGFAPLPRRLDEERPSAPRPTVEPVADARAFSLSPRRFETKCGGLFLFVGHLADLRPDKLATAAGLPGSKMIPAGHALRAGLAMKLWCVERKSHIMSLVADEGFALFCALNAMPKRSFLSEYSSRIDHTMTTKLLSRWHRQMGDSGLFPGDSFDLDFHSVPHHGADPIIERHYVSKRSRRQRSVLVFLAQDADGRAFCYSNADIRKGEEAGEITRFVSFWKRVRGKKPRELVFDSRLTTQAKLAEIDEMDIPFITLRRRSPAIIKEISELPKSAWRRIELDVPTRKYRTPRVYAQTVSVAGRSFRQVYVKDLGHDAPTVILTNQHKRSFKSLVTRYAQRMIIENVISDAVNFFHMDALSSSVALKANFDMALLVVASALYRTIARQMRGYHDAEARTIFRDLVDTPADVVITDSEVNVRFHRRAHLPIIMASGLLDKPVRVPWWRGRSLRLTV